MDLSQVEGWTRDLREAEGRRRGIKNGELRSPRGLLSLILKHRYGQPWSRGIDRLKRARRHAHSAVDVARSLIERPPAN